jgi:hypothetical protein
MIACTHSERAGERLSAPRAVKIQVVLAPTNITARGAGNVAPKVAHIWRQTRERSQARLRVTAFTERGSLRAPNKDGLWFGSFVDDDLAS